jgi:hypothetical protein
MPVLGAFVQGGSAKLFLPVFNCTGAGMSAGQLTAYPLAGNSMNANGVVLPASGTAANLPGFNGVLPFDIATTVYGETQCWGFASSVLISNVGSSLTLGQGAPIVPGAVAGSGFSLTPTYAASGFKYISDSNDLVAISAVGYISGIVRCF